MGDLTIKNILICSARQAVSLGLYYSQHTKDNLQVINLQIRSGFYLVSLNTSAVFHSPNERYCGQFVKAGSDMVQLINSPTHLLTPFENIQTKEKSLNILTSFFVT